MADGNAAPRFAVREIELYERPVVLRIPFRFGVVTLTHCPQAFVRARIERPDGSGAWGAAAEMLAPKWFDKNLALSNEDNFAQLRDVLRMTRAAYLGDPTPATAFGHFARHYDAHLAAARAKDYNPLLANYGPALVDRAILDALCRALGVSFYTGMRSNAAGIDAGHGGAAAGIRTVANGGGLQRPEFAGFDFDAFLAARHPAAAIAARHTVGLLDAITAADLAHPVGDGLPETLEQIVATYGQRYFKLKVGGNVDADLARLEAIASVLDRATAPYFTTLDGNEQYADAAGVAALVAGIRARPRLARLWQSVLFIEQPIARHAALDVDIALADLGKPVIIDESDGELDAFVRAAARGYRGVSSKTCKGLYKSVLNAARCVAWNAREPGTAFFMSGEDLTTQPGLALQQDLALVALLGIVHVERNGHHYVDGMAALPRSEQDAFLAAHPDLYEQSHGAARLTIRDGRIAIGSLDCIGYASAAMPDFQSMSRMA